MFETLRPKLAAELAAIRDAGLTKEERVLVSPQGQVVRLADGREVLVFCANNYLGLSSDPQVLAAAHAALESHGFGLSSVRFICGTQDLHKTLERRIADFLGMDDAIHAACFDANGGVFEPLLTNRTRSSRTRSTTPRSSTVRLCKAQRWRYAHNDLADLERCLQRRGPGCRHLLTHRRRVLDGRPHSDLGAICDLADPSRRW
jgi:glycine C-acetyltransferase